MLEHYGIITAMGPAGGWHYMQPTPEGEVRIPLTGRAATDEDLVKHVQHYRITNNLPYGDPAFDVAQYIRQRSPANNKWRRSKKIDEKITRVNKAPKNVPLIERIGNWLHRLAPRRPKLISGHDANERAPTCLGCRHNVKWATKCKPCIEHVIEMGQNLRQVVSAPIPDELGACRLHDLHLPSAVFVDQDHLPERSPEAPENCWLRAPSNETKR